MNPWLIVAGAYLVVFLFAVALCRTADTPTPEPPADTLDDELRALIAQHREEA